MKLKFNDITINGGGFYNNTVLFLAIKNSTCLRDVEEYEKDSGFGFRIGRKAI